MVFIKKLLGKKSKPSKSKESCIECGRPGGVFVSKKAIGYCSKCYDKLPIKEKLKG